MVMCFAMAGEPNEFSEKKMSEQDERIRTTIEKAMQDVFGRMSDEQIRLMLLSSFCIGSQYNSAS